MSTLKDEQLTNKRPEKSLTGFHLRTGGRNNEGRQTIRFRGGGHKRLYRRIDFRRDKAGIPATVVALEYDPNRSSRIALLQYKDGEKRYILAPVGLSVNDVVESGPESEVRPGNALPLANMPLGTTIHNIELKPGKGAS
jgi:large subunit ribosomal protein L2